MRKQYRRKEKQLFLIYLFLCCLIFALQAVGPWIVNFPYVSYELGDLIEGSMICLAFIYLMRKMRTNFQKVYNKYKCSMVLFFFLEMHVYFYWYVLPYLFLWVPFLDSKNNWNAYKSEYEFGVLYII